MRNLKNWKTFNENTYSDMLDKTTSDSGDIEEIKNALENNDSILIIGAPGMGKDARAKDALTQVGIEFKYIYDLDSEEELSDTISNAVHNDEYVLISDIDSMPASWLENMNIENIICTTSAINSQVEDLFDVVIK